MPIPQIDWLDPTDEQLVAYLRWKCEELDKLTDDHAFKYGIARNFIDHVANKIVERIDWRKQQREEFKDIGRFHRAAKARDAAWEAGCNERGEL